MEGEKEGGLALLARNLFSFFFSFFYLTIRCSNCLVARSNRSEFDTRFERCDIHLSRVIYLVIVKFISL